VLKVLLTSNLINLLVRHVTVGLRTNKGKIFKFSTQSLLE